jgi:uncharacterized RDD family membrane protein YckC
MDTPIHSTNEMIEPEHQEYTPSNAPRVFFAGFWMRFWAYLLDLLVVSSVNQLLIYPIFRIFDFPLGKDSMFAPLAILTAITLYLYFVLMTKFFRQTLGKMVFGLKVVDLELTGSLSWSTVIFREVVGKFISKTIFFIGFLVVAFSPKNQGIHDMFADTSVIMEKYSDV